MTARDHPVESPEPSRRTLLKGLLVGSVGTVDSRREAFLTLLSRTAPDTDRSPPAGHPEHDSSRGFSPAATDDETESISAIAPPTPERVSIRAIAEHTDRVEGPSYRLTDVAEHRGLLGVDHATSPRRSPPFRCRELITSQWVGDSTVASNADGSSWTNWVNDHSRSNLTKVKTESEADLREAVVWSARNENKIRAVGSGHSHSKVAAPEKQQSFLALSWNAAEDEIRGLIDPLPLAWLQSGVETDDLVRVQAGARIKYLNRKLLLEEGKALLNMGSFDGQTLAGAVNTSTHGTGARLGSLADTIRSVDLYTVMESPVRSDRPLVRKFRIEPETGAITDRAAFESAVGEHGAILIQDDDIFHSAVVGYGCMGVVYAYTMEVRDKYFLHEHNVTTKWDVLKKHIDSFIAEPDHSRPFSEVINPVNLPTGARHFQFRVNLAQVERSGPNDARNPRCLLTSHREPWQYSDGSSTHDRWQDKPSKAPASMNWPPERQVKSVQQWFRNTRKNQKGGFHPKRTPVFVPTGINSRFQTSQNNAPFETVVSQLNPHIDPGRSTTASYIALRRKVEDRPDPAVDPEPPPPAISTEIAVPADQVVPAVDAVIDEVIRNEYAYNVPMGVRFVDRTEHALSPEYRGADDRDVPVAKVEVPFLVRHFKNLRFTTAEVYDLEYFSQQEMLHHGKNALKAIEKRLFGMRDRGELDFARPHMGKTNDLIDRAALESMYDDFETWQAVHTRFDRFGTFDNAFTDDKGLNIG